MYLDSDPLAVIAWARNQVELKNGKHFDVDIK